MVLMIMILFLQMKVPIPSVLMTGTMVTPGRRFLQMTGEISVLEFL